MKELMDIPEFMRLSPEQRKEAWDKNPPKPPEKRGWRTAEQEAAEKERIQKQHDEKRLQRCMSKQKRINREQTQGVKLEDRSHAAQGHTWDVRTAKWIDPLEPALKGEDEMTATKKKKVKSNGVNENRVFEFRPDTNYARMTDHLMKNLDEFVKVEDLAKVAYATNADLVKHMRRVVRMATVVQEDVIDVDKLPYKIKKERKENVSYIGIFRKQDQA